MANIFKFLSKDGNITPEKARKSRQMQFHDKTAYVWGLRYRWDPLLSRNPVPRFPHFMPPWHSQYFLCNFVSHETIRKQPLLNPLLWVGDPLSEMVKMGLLYAWACVRVRLLWVDYLGIKQNQSSCIISWGYCVPEICVRISLIWVDYLGMGWWTGSWIKTKFCIISWGIVCLDLCQNQFDLGRLSWNSS